MPCTFNFHKIPRYLPYLGRASNFAHLLAYVLGLTADLKRKRIEPIAWAAGAVVRTLQEFLSILDWDHEAANDHLQRQVMDRHGCARAIAVLDARGHAQQGRRTPGVARQWCGETGKIDNCVMGQHLLYCDNHPSNPFHCALASDLFLPKAWERDAVRRRKAHIPADVWHRPKWRMALDQLQHAIANGVRFWFTVFDEDYGKVPAFWFELDALGPQAIGEVPANFRVFAKRPACRSQRKEHRSKRVDNLCRFSPLFREQAWQRVTVRGAPRGPIVWEVKRARVHLVIAAPRPSRPTDRPYARLIARHAETGEIKYFIRNAAAGVPLADLLPAAFARWSIERWFGRAKPAAGLGAFEVRTYRRLLRHWFCSRLAMYFLAAQTPRRRGEKSAHPAGTGGRGGQRPGLDDLETDVARAG
jgi:SRSO17 transposase